MIAKLILATILACCTEVLAVEPGTAAATDTRATLPDNWNGVWRGEIEVLVDGKRQHRATMELRVQKLGDDGAKSWTIQYSGQPPRLYEIRPAPDAKGRFIVDEKDGTLLEDQLIGNILHSVFSLGDVLLTSRFENRGEEITVEIATFAFDATKLRDALNSPAKATSYSFRSIQRGILRRQK